MVKKWEIYFLDFDPIKGSEQRGVRPALIISNDSVNKHLPLFTVIPFSSIKEGAKIYPSEVALPTSVTGLSKDSVAMLQQIRTMSTDRLQSVTKVGEITDKKYREKINRAIVEYFELEAT
ncbi:MAG: type II toxin-antitoxin system PemK/MazF family toxin [Clostridiales bacterium]|jgi:mRNA interferase MazF|nr:type II toxin-antitoxin system PemK/MazF family toxin [Clostridiales bacterium]